MSSGVVRSNNTRRYTRNNHASPYSRPRSQPAKKASVRVLLPHNSGEHVLTLVQGWSLSGLLSYLNPFASRSEEEEDDVESGSESPGEDAAARLTARGQQVCSMLHHSATVCLCSLS